MGNMRGVFERLRLHDAPVVEEPQPAPHPENGEKQAPIVDDKGHEVVTDSESISSDAQGGVKKIEATTKVWGKGSLIVAYIL